MLKYHSGDKVIVKRFIDILEYYMANSEFENLETFLKPDMSQFCEKEVTIVNRYDDTDVYTIQEDNGTWHWQDYMFKDDTVDYKQAFLCVCKDIAKRDHLNEDDVKTHYINKSKGGGC